ncbi:3152_t:CDS:2 [Diversispora eburnea]|uniref:3152_t:CDS:1 n=1 Tax=Diversispora eburnea TaxID=1213867 RepID=A0A9N9ASL7_9GLOM|nr:3152_t:CDS:2 [Diversispora eburnea]
MYSLLQISPQQIIGPKIRKSYFDNNGNEMPRPLYGSLALICDNILNMGLKLVSYSQAQLLSTFRKSID